MLRPYNGNASAYLGAAITFDTVGHDVSRPYEE
jgi:hypothetical protein